MSTVQPTITRDGHTITIGKYGFPLEACGRCGGSGHFSYNPMDGTVCFECG